MSNFLVLMGPVLVLVVNCYVEFLGNLLLFMVKSWILWDHFVFYEPQYVCYLEKLAVEEYTNRNSEKKTK